MHWERVLVRQSKSAANGRLLGAARPLVNFRGEVLELAKGPKNPCLNCAAGKQVLFVCLPNKVLQ